ncbi:MAG: aromatic ring-hydroxylating dioxygenase subunit alpha [Deltaproteobacteria bacterium]|nr:aromatic ring-hydroxylating dioxygenase subunit alpha [Kofleriaceae bacterium]
MSKPERHAGYATGWFVVAATDELPVGKVLPLAYFGKHLVAFRGERGQVSVLDAHCPHLGAHLGHGGAVVGDSIKCPFHAWRFAGDGACVEIPYDRSDNKPRSLARAQTRCWPVSERNGLVFVWHDALGRAPTYEIPVIAEHGSEEWTPWTRSIMTIKTHPREIIENVADSGHFPAVHGTDLETFENEFIEHVAIQRSTGVAHPIGGGDDRFKLTATYYGPAYQVTEMESFIPNRLINAHTPIDEHTLHLRFGVMLKKVGDEKKMARYAQAYADNLTLGFQQDVAIWENKVWRDRPTLCDGDGAIGALRRWYRQFYVHQDAHGKEEQAS